MESWMDKPRPKCSKRYSWAWDRRHDGEQHPASYLDLLLSIESDGQLRTSLYDKRDDYNFNIKNFPFQSSNIPYSPAYGVFISQLIRYARACSFYEAAPDRDMSWNVWNRPSGSFMVDMVEHYEVSLSQMLHDILGHDHIQWHHQLIRHYTNLRKFPNYQISDVSIEHCNGYG